MNRLRITLASIAVGGIVGAGIMGIGVARADVTVCDYLDAHPSLADVEDLLAMGVYGNQWSSAETAQFIVAEVKADCPRHMFTLQEAVRRSNQGYMV